jgi:hypothetical protein
MMKIHESFDCFACSYNCYVFFWVNIFNCGAIVKTKLKAVINEFIHTHTAS